MKRQRNFLNKNLRSHKAIALILFYFALAGFFVVFGSFIIRGIVENKMTRLSQDELQAYYLAEAGLDQVKRGLYDAFRSNYANIISADFSWFDSLPDSSKYTLPNNAILGIVSGGTYTVNITNVDNPVDQDRDITMVCTATVNNIPKTITAVIRYSSRPAQVFDYAYLVNNFGWFWGGGITSQGDIRSNGNFSFGGNPTVNGDIYASTNSDLGATGDISGNSRNDSLDFYRNQADSTARPTNPTANPQDIDGDGIDEEFPYPHGYDGASDRLPQQPVLSMPYLGNLTYYKTQAIAEGGTITQCGSTLVTNVLEDNITLIGTDSCPIEINGPVVITKDVLIKGVVKGQGTIFSGRNTHIIGDITYENPPSWSKPDTTPSATDAQNATKDFLGLATKGNVIVGDYTRRDWQRNVARYLRPPFTQAYQVDSTDSEIGYVQYYSGGDPYFDGNYTANDGGTKLDGTARRFYESSYDDAYFQSVAEGSNQIRRVDAVTYNNHAFAGRVGSFTMNGSIIARDEAIVYSGSLTLNYDVRVQLRQTADDFYLPRQLDVPHTRFFRKN